MTRGRIREPERFHVVSLAGAPGGDCPLQRLAVDGLVVVDVQLTDLQTATDEAFTWEYGKAVAPGRYRHQCLPERIGGDEMLRIRRFVATLLAELAGGDGSVVWFISGGMPEDDRISLPDHVHVTASMLDSAGANCSSVLYSTPCDHSELECQLRQLGNFDRVRGAMGHGLLFPHVLSILTLGNPLPSASLQRIGGPDQLSALTAVLAHASLFFEEVNNGTRLRLVTGSKTREELEAGVELARLQTLE